MKELSFTLVSFELNDKHSLIIDLVLLLPTLERFYLRIAFISV
jgi:hypothetical protein